MRTLDLRNALLDIHLPTVETSVIEITQALRPDPAWLFIDVQGHQHRWDGSSLSTLTEVIDVEAVMGCDEDGEEFVEIPAITHLECSICGALVSPGYKSDNEVQYIAGLKRFPDIEIVLGPEKLLELMEIFNTNEKCLIVFMDGIDPIIGRVVAIQTSVTDYIRATIRRTV